MAGLHFELVTPERLMRTGEVHMVVVPGSEGDFGVLAGHAPMLSTIRPGEIAIYATPATEKPERLTVKGGLAEVNARGLTILAEHVAEVTAH